MKEKIIIFTCFMVLFYLMGAFIAASFNIAEWNEGLRAAITFFGFLGSIFLTGLILDIKDIEK